MSVNKQKIIQLCSDINKKEGEGTMFEQGRISAFEDAKLFLDTLEVKEVQEDPVSDDLNTLTYNYLRSYGKPEANVEYLTFASCVANWQKEKDNRKWQ